MLYEKKIEDILWDSKEASKEKKDLKSTTVFLPQILRLGLGELKEKKGITMRKTVRAVIEHGHSIIQNRHAETIKEINKIKSEIRYAKLRPLRNYNEAKITIDGMESPMKKYIQLKEGILSSIRELSEILSIEQSSFIRLCMFYSFSTSEILNEEITMRASLEVVSFEEHLKEISFTYRGFKKMEEEYLKEK